ncbi:unnamed protein product [Rhodiola kirilowii]
MPGITAAGDSFAAGDILDDLPLQMFKSEVIPPAPNLTGSAIDFLLDFAGYGWLAYGASSLFVISHFPSPASPSETLIGPIMRQTFDLAGYVNAVAWSPVTPSTGEVAVAAENRIALYSHDSECSSGSFGWSQNAVLVQDTKVDVLKWTASGDGIVAGGVELVLWKNTRRSWGVVWKFRNELPQDLIATTWSIEGPLATAAAYREDLEGSSAMASKDRKYVSLCQSNERFEYTKVELYHPQPITMIQWRPQKRRKPDPGVRHPMWNVLMTCSVDGTVRLWCEIDNGKVSKLKDINYQKTLRHSFCVAAVIEVNHVLDGTLGSDIFVEWATESQVGIGPGKLLTLWAIRYLDYVSPVRFPQMTLWQRQEIPGLDLVSCSSAVDSSSNNQAPFNKVIFSRNNVSAPPTVCSLVHLLPGNSVRWSMLYAATRNDAYTDSNKVNDKSSTLSCQAHEILELDGHSGKILDVAVHPNCLSHHFAASLDSKGKVLFWSLSTNNQCTFGMPNINPSWKVCGELFFGSLSPKYTSIVWAPSAVEEDFILLMGHAGGIDCYIVEFLNDEVEAVKCHHICTVPSHNHHAAGPTCTSAIPFPSTCSQDSYNCEFILLGVWMDNFEALSWEVTVHSSHTSKTSRGCENGSVEISKSSMRFEHILSGKKYCVLVNPCASQFPQLHARDPITSISTVCTGSSIYSLQMKHNSVNDARYSVYHLATGNSDGTVKLWRSNFTKTLSLTCQWELVGTFSSDENPVSALSMTDCGRKIATITTFGNSTTSVLRVWECIHLLESGSIFLEDTIHLDNHVVALRWLASGTGQFLLGVCMPNKIQLFTQSRCGGRSLLGSQTKVQIWLCLASTQISPPVNGFLWGPGGAPLVIHEYYFGLLEQWLCDMDVENRTTHHSFFTAGEPSTGETSRANNLECPEEVTVHTNPNMKLGSRTSILELADKLARHLPVYHPESLIANIFAGNWKRARFALRFLIEHFTERESSETKSLSPAPQIPLSEFFEGHNLGSSTVNERQWSAQDGSSSKVQSGFSAFAFGSEYDVPHIATSSSDSEISGFNKQMEKLLTLGYVTDIEKLQTCAIMDLLNEISSTHSASMYGSLDDPGRRFWVAVRFQMMLIRQRSGILPSTRDLRIDSKIICWAFHSDCQENLFGSLLPNEPSWSDMRAIGFGFWFTDATQLRTKMEKLARLQYLKNKDPKDCALLYVALNRIQVLAGLFKISRDEKDKPLVGFLSRNFQEEKNKAAALKNAYVLMGRHQLELAIAFFLLGGDTSSAITVCAKNLGDEQLALVICRLIEGHGGRMKSHLVSSYLLPTAMEKGDYWLQSLFEWELGNYSQSFLAMLGTQRDSKPIITYSSASCLDPSIGQYCMLIASKTCMKNALGEKKAAVLSKWATLISAISLNRCGLPLEGLEILSSSSHGVPGGINQEKSFHTESIDTFHDILQLPTPKFSNWLSGGISCHFDAQTKLELALKYFSKLMKEHPNWPENYLATGRVFVSEEDDNCQYEMSLKTFLRKLHSGVGVVEQKFALSSSPLVDMMVFFLCNNRLLFMAYTILLENASQGHSKNMSELLLALPSLPKLLFKSAKEISFSVSRFTLSCCVTCSQPRASFSGSASSSETASCQSDAGCFNMHDLLHSLWNFRSSFQICSSSSIHGVTRKPFLALDFLEYLIYFAAAWLQKNVKGLILLVQTFAISYNEHVPYEVCKSNLKSLRTDILQVLMDHSPKCDSECELLRSEETQNGDGEELKFAITMNEKWQIIGVCLWRQISTHMRHQLDDMSTNDKDPSSASHISVLSESADDSVGRLIKLVSNITTPLLGSILEHLSSYHAKLLGSLLLRKLDNQQGLPTLDWLGECIQSQSEAFKRLDSGSPTVSNEDKLWDFTKLWDILVDMKIISEGFAQENINLLRENSLKPLKRWNRIYKDIQMLFEKEASNTQEHDHASTPASSETVSPGGFFRNGSSFFSSRRRSTIPKEELVLFDKPKEIYKRNGELFEAVCVNSIYQRQAALASNKKGILFFQWNDGSHVVDQREYLWSEADWPHHGWAKSISDSSDTSIDGKNVIDAAGSGSSPAKFERDKGQNKGHYLSWDVEDLLIDSPATVNNTISRAFSSHPSRPFFLVGSANTHIYLWEFGKDRATATYGVLPAASVPPTYAIPSISALEFDACGHRFSAAALDGTISTWQLEVGGRSNVLPTESLSCFDGFASDITYITASGSIVAASGYGSDGFNAVIWDTLAPPSTSRASIRCHEGGAHSIAVFDNGLGSGSISPLIITGGKDGDIGLHDFRYVATGKMKRNKTFNNTEQDPNSVSNSPKKIYGDQNATGMLWYIPKAHIGSVTKIAAIPNTSLFLTGSKDGDVKLWDAQKSRLVFHWQKLHERHTFLQPSMRGYSGVIQAGVTDINVVTHGFLTCGGDGSPVHANTQVSQKTCGSTNQFFTSYGSSIGIEIGHGQMIQETTMEESDGAKANILAVSMYLISILGLVQIQVYTNYFGKLRNALRPEDANR